MPAPRKPPQEESTAMVVATQSSEVQLSDIDRDTYIQKGDFSGLNESVRTMLCAYVSVLAGLDPRMGYVTCINLQGKMVPYIRSAGIAEIARNKVKSLKVTEPKFIFRNAAGGSAPLAVSVVCTVETAEGKTFEDIGCVDCTGQTAFDVMKASTRARSRALKLAVGVHLLSEEEVSEQRQVKKEQGTQ